MTSPATHTGTLRTWLDDKGFGFIAPNHGGAELFVHISAFPRDGTRPVQGESLSYELGRGKDGKPQAVRVLRKAIGPHHPLRPKTVNARKSTISTGSVVKTVFTVLLIAGAGIFAFKAFQGQSQRRALETMRQEERQPSASPQAVSTKYRCDGRKTCPQMGSCEEATWFLHHCPGMEMDGNHDGVPCEQQHCTSVLNR
jgi:cold shock CspA family protein